MRTRDRRLWPIAATALTWTAAAAMYFGVAPGMLADTSELALPRSASGAAIVGASASVLAGALMLTASLAVAFRPLAELAARSMLVVAGGIATLTGLVISTGGVTFLGHGEPMRVVAAAMLCAAAADVLAGIVALTAGTTHYLPGRSLRERMWNEHPAVRTLATRGRHEARVLAFFSGWAILLVAFVGAASLGAPAGTVNALLLLLMLLVPLLAGALVASVRDDDPDRLATLEMSCAAALAVLLADFAALFMWETVHAPGTDLASGTIDPDVPVMVLVLGLALGAAGNGLSHALELARPRPHARPR